MRAPGILICAFATLSVAIPESKGAKNMWNKLKSYDFSLKRDVSDPDRIKATSLMQRRGLADCEKAVELFEKALSRNPDDARLCCECAHALSKLTTNRTLLRGFRLEASIC